MGRCCLEGVETVFTRHPRHVEVAIFVLQCSRAISVTDVALSAKMDRELQTWCASGVWACGRMAVGIGKV